MLSGKIPGVRIVQRTAEPGGYENTLIYAVYKAAPLVVIDGVSADQVSNVWTPTKSKAYRY
jgi:hypothetical protein